MIKGMKTLSTEKQTFRIKDLVPAEYNHENQIYGKQLADMIDEDM